MTGEEEQEQEEREEDYLYTGQPSKSESFNPMEMYTNSDDVFAPEPEEPEQEESIAVKKDKGDDSIEPKENKPADKEKSDNQDNSN